tara:strand:+ start:229 stop:456 length:228 start_codon:yes stop_codon:yes gene_type:complete
MMSKEEMIDGYTFKYNEEHKFYECRGDVCYDEDHDEVPEEGLWTAGCKLEQKLKNQGIDAEVEYSEKGWIEVCIN